MWDMDIVSSTTPISKAKSKNLLELVTYILKKEEKGKLLDYEYYIHTKKKNEVGRITYFGSGFWGNQLRSLWIGE